MITLGWPSYFTARSILVPYAFVREKSKTLDFSETIVFHVISQLNEYMNLYDIKGQGHLLTLVQITQIQHF